VSINLPDSLLDRLHRKADADRWGVARERLAEALESSASKALGDRAAGAALESYVQTLHVADLALACACADGHDPAWEHFVLELRPALYRAADVIDPNGNARDLADGLYAELFGVDERGRERPSLFRYYHGRSSLATWLRAVLAQRHVDRLRVGRRTTALPDEEPPAPATAQPDPRQSRWTDLVTAALKRSVAALDARDRLRLASYYLDGRTLAETGRMLHEHEATVSRHLARIRRDVRQQIERDLRGAGLSAAEIEQSLASVAEDPGTLDLGRVLQTQEAQAPIVQNVRGTP
jgi:RNA polymerase sigma-70 factor (ECF subfamily)